MGCFSTARQVLWMAFTAVTGTVLFLSCDLPFGVESQPEPKIWTCVNTQGAAVEYLSAIGCKTDFDELASEPLSTKMSGATSGKTVIDLNEEDPPLYFQNSKKYPIHYDFASTHLSTANGKQNVPSLDKFNITEYSSPTRRFVLGALTYYEGPKKWVYEIAAYDNAGADMIALAYNKISDSTFFGDSLYFHPASQEIEAVAATLPETVKIITTEELYEGIDYQPLNLGTSIGHLIFVTADELDNSYVGFRDIVVLDEVPNDISVTSGIITHKFQTPLAHINVLSRNRGTPNMGLRGAFSNETLRALEGKWVQYTVGANEWHVSEVTQAEADAWWEEHRPDSVGIADMDLETKELRNVEDLLDLDTYSLEEAIDAALPAYGGKATHFGGFPHMDNTKIRYPKGFAIPVFYYWQFMEQNGFNALIDSLLADNRFTVEAAVRDSCLEKLRKAMESKKKSTIDPAFQTLLQTKLTTEYPGIRMRFRSSTNAEDLDGFTGAGLYTSKSGDADDIEDQLDAIREVWASVWFFRAFEERSYRNIDHKSVGMALLVHRSFPDEEANGVAITANIFDPQGIEPGYYVNVQKGDLSVVLPDPSITTDQLIYHMEMDGQPVVYIANSSEVAGDEHVLTKPQIRDLGVALKEIHRFYQKLYQPDPTKWYAMDTEFKFDQTLDDPDGPVVLFMKQCRPYPAPN